MSNWNTLPKIKLGVYPTPFYRLENISRLYNKSIWIKRDDLCGVALGGNKVRKLEYLLADAQKQGCDTVFTTGGAQSNHAMLTAACASRLGMRAVLVLKKRGELAGGNQILNGIFGAEVCFVDTDSYDDVYAQMHRMMEQEKQQGHTPYFIPVGGSVPLGSLGYVNCAHEIAQQAEQMTLSADSLSAVTPEMLKVKMVDSTRAALVSGAQSAMIGYEQLLLQKESLEDSITLLEEVYKSTQTQASLGLATENAVLTARQNLESAQAGRLALDASEVKLRQSLCTLLGWEYNGNPEIRKVPEADLSRIGAMDPAADKQAAIDNNYTLKYNRLSYEQLTDGSVEQQNMARTIEDQTAAISSSLENLYNQVLQKRNEYQTAVAALELEKTKMEAADRKMSVGTIGRLEYLQQKNSYAAKETAVKTADLALFQAMETYDQAVEGNLSVS